MNRLVMIFSIMIFALIQAVLPAWYALGQAKAPVLLGGVLYYALTREDSQVVEAAIFAGMLQDSLGPIPLGYSALAFTVVALFANHYRERVFAESIATHMLIGMAGAIVVTLLLFVLLVSDGHRVVILPFVMSKAWGVSLLALVTIPLCFKVVEWMDIKLGNVEMKEI